MTRRSYKINKDMIIFSFQAKNPQWGEIKTFLKDTLKCTWHPVAKFWFAKNTGDILAKARDYGFKDEDEITKELLERSKESATKIAEIGYPPLPLYPMLKDIELNEKLLPDVIRPYQVEAVKFLESRFGKAKGAILAMPMGSGKGIMSVSFLAQHKWDKPMLIVVPASLKTHWKRELSQWGHINSQIIYSTFKMNTLRSHVEALVVNFEILHKLQDELVGNISCIVVDEADNLQAESNKRVDAFNEIQKSAEFRIFLTGTPTRNQALNMYNLLKWSDDYWKNKTDFKQRYCDYGLGFGGRWTINGSKNLDELHERIQPWVMYKSLEEILPDLPKVNQTIYQLKATDEIKTISDEINEILSANGWDIEDVLSGELDTQDAKVVALLSRIEELSRSSYAFKRGAVQEFIQTFLNDGGESIVLVAYHQAVIDDLKATFGFEAIDGRVNPAHRQAIVDRFNSGERRGIILQLQAGSVGFSLPYCRHMVYVEQNYSFRDLTQMAARIRRLTSTSDNAFYSFFVFKDTIDENQLTAMTKKGKMSSKILTGEAVDIFDKSFTVYEELD